MSLASPTLAGEFFTTEPPGKLLFVLRLLRSKSPRGFVDVTWGFLLDKKQGSQCPPVMHSTQGKSGPWAPCKEVKGHSGFYPSTYSIASSPVRAPKCSENKNVSSTIPPPLQASVFLSSPRLLSLSLVSLYSSPSGFCTQAFLGSHYNHSGVASLCSALSTLNYTLCTFHVAA